MSQPLASQGLARLQNLLGDALFERSGLGVRPTPRADRLAQAVQSALATIEEALNTSQVFDPLRSKRVLRVHLSDIGEARFLLSWCWSCSAWLRACGSKPGLCRTTKLAQPWTTASMG